MDAVASVASGRQRDDQRILDELNGLQPLGASGQAARDQHGQDLEADMRVCIDHVELLAKMARSDTSDLLTLWRALRGFNVNDHCRYIEVRWNDRNDR